MEALRTGLVEPAIERGWQVAVTLTPTAGAWLRQNGEVERLERLTGLTVRDAPRFPGEARPHPLVDCYAVAPASANTVAKIAAGIADNQALTQVGEAIGTLGLPVVLFPRVNAAHARHPMWRRHLEVLTEAEVHLVYGADVWPLYEPRDAPAGRELPWSAVLDAVEQATK
ncbi:flavoprotein [Streptomyces sp. H39-C1]|uniref:flavoprotein n=1 Tax=Streptomyces sp. H39-C1 TaxID=3004355 RepID=UPI0022AFC7F0|nr:flavoprotein [Streptomyces sp. H39-C1]MCZ4095993.1 flavoprotein [Streptomyces sp. H39-C1]